jgi:hypothetical protein
MVHLIPSAQPGEMLLHGPSAVNNIPLFGLGSRKYSDNRIELDAFSPSRVADEAFSAV